MRLCTPLRAEGFAAFTPGEPGKHAAQQAWRAVMHCFAHAAEPAC